MPPGIHFFAAGRRPGSGSRGFHGLIELQGNTRSLPHEVGHAIDKNIGNWSRGTEWSAALLRAPRLMNIWRRWDDQGGRRHSRCGDDYFSSPQETFARAFEYFVATHGPRGRWASHAKRRFVDYPKDEMESLSHSIASSVVPILEAGGEPSQGTPFGVLALLQQSC
jgi:hypothetical protein